MHAIGQLNDDDYVAPKDAANHLKVSPKTLTLWAGQGDISFIKTNGKHRRYLVSDIKRAIGYSKPVITTDRRRICYCRVSTRGQLKDLERQREFFIGRYPSHEIVTDIGSGLNFNRKGFNSILESALKGNIEEIIITSKDRLCRFAYNLFERVIKQSKGRIVVLDEKEYSAEEELVHDLISIITCFSARVYGLRSHKIKKAIREATGVKNNEVPIISLKRRERKIEDIE